MKQKKFRYMSVEGGTPRCHRGPVAEGQKTHEKAAKEMTHNELVRSLQERRLINLDPLEARPA